MNLTFFHKRKLLIKQLLSKICSFLGLPIKCGNSCLLYFGLFVVTFHTIIFPVVPSVNFNLDDRGYISFFGVHLYVGVHFRSTSQNLREMVTLEFNHEGHGQN